MIELSVDAKDDSSHSSIIAEIADEYSERICSGEIPDIEEYTRRIPGSEAIIRDILNSLRLMHDMRACEASSDEQDEEPNAISGSIGEYEILGELGRGGMGVVYRARQANLGRIVALKVLPFAASLDPIKLKRFQIETQSASMIQHPNVVAIYGTGCHQGVHYYAMQFVDGQPLDQYIAAVQLKRKTKSVGSTRVAPHSPIEISGVSTDSPRRDETAVHTINRLMSSGAEGRRRQLDEPIVKQMSFRQIAELGRHVALALHYAHEYGVVHRDIKPSNLIIDRSGKVWITDFGLAHIETGGTLTATGDIVGTLRYMSPEQANGGSATIDRRSDVYSLGATLYELLSLEPMIQGDDRAQLLRQLTVDQPRPVRKINPAIPRDLETILLKAVALDCNQRYPTAAALADDLTCFLEDRPILARRPTVVQFVTKLARRHRTAAWTIATIPILIVAGLILSNIEISRQKVRAEEALKIAQASEDRALTEAAKSRTISDVLQQLVASANPMQSKGNEYTVRQLLDDLSSTIFDQLHDQPDVEASLRSTVGNAYRTLGAPDKAAPHLARALELKMANRESNDLQIAESLEDLAWNEAGLNQYAQQEVLARQTIALHQKGFEQGKSAVHALWCLQHSLVYQDKYAEADSTAQNALTLARQIQPTPPETANILHLLSQSKTFQKEFDQAELFAKESVELHSKLHGVAHPETGWGLDALARTLQAQEKYAEAEDAYREALAIFRKNYSSDHKSVRMTLELLNDVLDSAGKKQEAEFIEQQRFADTIRSIVATSASQKMSLLELLVDRKQYLAAGQLIMSAPNLFQDTVQCLRAVEILIEYSNAIGARFKEDRDEQAKTRWLDTSSELLDRAVKLCPNNSTMQNSVAWILISHPDARLHQPLQAIELVEKALTDAPSTGEFWNTLGLARLRAGEYIKAIETIEKSRTFPSSDEYDLVFLAMARWQTGATEQALELLSVAKSMREKRETANLELDRFFAEADGLIHR